MEQELQEIKKCVKEIHTALVGKLNDSENPGLITRIDRLEQSKKFKDKILWIIVGNIAYLLLTRLL